MKLLEKTAHWWRELFRRRRLSLRNAIDEQEEWYMHISPAGVASAFVALLLVLFILILVLAAYTPVLEFLPGYRTEAARSRENMIANIMRLDSMERMMNDMLTYNENIAMIMEGRTPVLRTPMNDDTTRLDKTLVPPSQLDSLLRAQMEGEGDYSLSRTLRERERGGNLPEFAVPAEGIITRHFSRKDNYLGVGIQAAPNAPVTAIDDGTVIDVAAGVDGGNTVTVQHFNGFISVYRNLAQILVSKGQPLKSGQVIGYNAMREEGDRTNPLVELEIWNEGKAVDPEIYIVF